jgi:hypothetical protein
MSPPLIEALGHLPIELSAVREPNSAQARQPPATDAARPMAPARARFVGLPRDAPAAFLAAKAVWCGRILAYVPFRLKAAILGPDNVTLLRLESEQYRVNLGFHPVIALF